MQEGEGKKKKEIILSPKKLNSYLILCNFNTFFLTKDASIDNLVGRSINQFWWGLLIIFGPKSLRTSK